MTASAAAARLGEGLPGPAVLAVVVAGGLIEGIALGTLQALWLARRFPGVSRPGWAVITVLIAGIGWALASTPSAFGPQGDGPEPHPLLILLMAAGLGAAMGAVLGVAQAFVLRVHVRHPWRWVGISTAAWTPAMAIIFAGATIPDASWPTGIIIVWGTLTGAVAGAALGSVSAPLMKTLTGQSFSARVLAWAVRHRTPGLGGTFAVLRITGRRTGRVYELPVQYAREDDTVVVLPGGAKRKTWWRNLQSPARLSMFLDDKWTTGTGHAISDQAAAYPEARAIYSRRWTKVPLPSGALLVRIQLEDPGPAQVRRFH